MQTLTAASTFEAELIALSFAGNEALWIRKLMGELRFALPSNINIRSKAEPDADATAAEIDPDSVLESPSNAGDADTSSRSKLAPTPVLVDNKSVEYSVNNPETSQRTRHIATRYFKVRDYVRELEIRVRHVGTDVNVSDFYTKALPRIKFQEYRNYLGMEDHTPT